MLRLLSSLCFISFCSFSIVACATTTNSGEAVATTNSEETAVSETENAEASEASESSESAVIASTDGETDIEIKDPDKIICKSRPSTGSRLRRSRDCRTRAEWEWLRRRAEEDIALDRSGAEDDSCLLSTAGC